MGNLRAGLIGMGSIGRHHARILSSLEGVTLVGIVDSGDIEKPPAKEFSSLDELLKQGIDYCVVAVPTILHAEIGLYLASQGVHALIEKPITDSLDSAVAVSAAFKEQGLIGAVGHVERFNGPIQQARMRIEGDQLGQIFQIATRRQSPFPARIADVGVVKDLATHDIELTSWVSSSFYDSVSAQISHKAGREFEDLVIVNALMDSQIVVSHQVNWLSPFKERSITITGEKGSFVADTLNGDLTFFANGNVPAVWEELAQFRGVSEGDVVRYAFPKPEPLRAEHEAFRDAVLGLSNKIVSMDEGVRVLAVAEAILESAKFNSVVHLQGNMSWN